MSASSLCAGCVALVVLVPSVAFADASSDAARAEALFNSAKRIRDAGQFADACPLFAESGRLAPGVGVLLYLGECSERIGRTASAWAAFQSAEKLARERDDRRVDIAHARAAALAPAVNGLTLVVPAPVAAASPEVQLDGTRIPPDEWNAAIAVDPGEHTVTVNGPGRPPRTLHAHIDAGTRLTTVSLADPAAAAPAPATSATVAALSSEAPAPAPGPHDPGFTRRWIGIGLLGAGAVGIGIGTTILLNRDQASPPSCSAQPRDSSAAIASGALFVAGGAALIAGLALTVTTPGKGGGVGLVAAPLLVAGGAGAVVRTAF